MLAGQQNELDAFWARVANRLTKKGDDAENVTAKSLPQWEVRTNLSVS
jgi:hypothetical protein